MKTIIKVILVIAFAIFADTLFASGNLRVNILPISAEKAFVDVLSPSTGNFDLTVTNAKGEVFYSKENLEPTEDYRAEYNFHALENGKYKVTAVGQDITTERLFRMTDKGIKIGKEKTYQKPFFGYKDGIISYTFLNFQNENLTMHLLNKKQVLFTKDLGNTFTVSDALNLSTLRNGTYEIVLSAGNKEYSYTIDKQ